MKNEILDEPFEEEIIQELPVEKSLLYKAIRASGISFLNLIVTITLIIISIEFNFKYLVLVVIIPVVVGLLYTKKGFENAHRSLKDGTKKLLEIIVFILNIILTLIFALIAKIMFSLILDLMR